MKEKREWLAKKEVEMPLEIQKLRTLQRENTQVSEWVCFGAILLCETLVYDLANYLFDHMHSCCVFVAGGFGLFACLLYLSVCPRMLSCCLLAFLTFVFNMSCVIALSTLLATCKSQGVIE